MLKLAAFASALVIALSGRVALVAVRTQTQADTRVAHTHEVIAARKPARAAQFG